MAFATEDDLATKLQGSVNGDTAALALALATASIQEFVGWNVEQETATYTTDGGVGVVFLPTIRLTAVTSVTDTGTALVSGTDYVWSENGIIRRAPAGTLFLTGMGTVVVNYTHGYAPDQLPVAFKSICLQVASRMYDNPEMLRQSVVGGISDTYDVSAANYAWGPSLLPSEQAMLSRHRLITAG